MLDPHDLRGDSKGSQPTSSNDWMLTFADLLSLMLTFFVLLFSMSTVKVNDWRSMVESLSKEFNPGRVQIDIVSLLIDRTVGDDEEDGLDTRYLARLLTDMIASEPVLSGLLVGQARDEVVLSIPAHYLFEQSSLTFTEYADERVELIANKLRLIRNIVKVGAHTSPAAHRLFAGDDIAREFTLARSRAVTEKLKDYGYRQPVLSIGYGTSRFDDLDPDLPQYERQNLADRVDIMIVKEGRSDFLSIF